MEATNEDLSRFLMQSNAQFCIPVFQRTYEWGTEQCDQLIEDILDVAMKQDENAEHFVGAVVFVDMKHKLNEFDYVTRYTIIDGQQRLITVTLIYLAIMAILREHRKTDLAKKVKEMVLVNPNLDASGKLKILALNRDQVALQKLIENDGTEPKSRIVDSAVIPNYRHILKAIRDRYRVDETVIDDLVQGITRLKFIRVRLEKGRDDPQRIFQSLNATGKKLNQQDLIRNHLLMEHDIETQTVLHDAYWAPMEEELVEWSISKNSEKCESRLGEFFRAFLASELGALPPNSKVFQKYQEVFGNLKKESIERNTDHLKRQLRIANLFARMYNFRLEGPENEDPNITEALAILSVVPYKVSLQPFALTLFDCYDKGLLDSSSLLEMLRLLESHLYRWFFTSYDAKHSNKLLPELGKKVHNRLKDGVQVAHVKLWLARKLADKDVSTACPDDDAVRNAIAELRTLNGEQIATVLARVNNKLGGHPNSPFPEMIYSATKIFDLHVDYSMMLVYDHGNVEWLKERTSRLANHTITKNKFDLGKSLNSRLTNLGDPMYYDSMPIYQPVAGLQYWSKEHYLNYEKWLTDQILELWPHPSVFKARFEEETYRIA